MAGLNGTSLNGTATTVMPGLYDRMHEEPTDEVEAERARWSGPAWSGTSRPHAHGPRRRANERQGAMRRRGRRCTRNCSRRASASWRWSASTSARLP